MTDETKKFQWRFAGVGLLALAGGACLFGVPNSAWADEGGTLPKILPYLGGVAWAYVLYFISKNIK